MTLDELISTIERCSQDMMVQRLASWMRSFKADSYDAGQFTVNIDRFLDHLQRTGNEGYVCASQAWREFRGGVIEAIHGMTMKERLYAFSLIEEFDAAGELDRPKFYAKLLAKP